MKIEKLSDDNLIVFLNKFYIMNHNFSLKNHLEDYFKNMFIIFNNNYNIEINGYYNITVYQDSVFGVVLKFNKEDISLYGYYDDHIDMKINIIKPVKFVYLINKSGNIDKKVLEKCYIYKDKSDLYLVPKKNIDQYSLGRLIENSTIIYDKRAEQIINSCNRINSKQILV